MRKLILILSIIVLLFIIACQSPYQKLKSEDVFKKGEMVCNKPYILVGTSCCLDKDDNKICDTDEADEALPEEPEIEEIGNIETILTVNIGTINPIGGVIDKDLGTLYMTPVGEMPTGKVSFKLNDFEYQNLEKAELRFKADCGQVSDLGVLYISVNENNIFTAKPICADRYKQDILPEYLKKGTNIIEAISSKGLYSITDIKTTLIMKDISSMSYTFNTQKNDDKFILHLTFLNGKNVKRMEILVNNNLLRVDQKGNKYFSDITQFVTSGKNSIEITSKTTVDISELKITKEKFCPECGTKVMGD